MIGYVEHEDFDKDLNTYMKWLEASITTTSKYKEIPVPIAEDLKDPMFNAIWNVTKTWDVEAPEYLTGLEEMKEWHVLIILQAVRDALNKTDEGSKDV